MFVGSLLFGYFVVGCVAIPFPSLPEQFSVDINMTKKDSGEWLGYETMAFDLSNKRNHIQVNGPGFGGHPWGQLTFTPEGAQDAWFVQYVVSPFHCDNKTVDMEWNPFWSFPNAVYNGTFPCPDDKSKKCNAWYSVTNGDTDTLYLSLNNEPVAIDLMGKFLYFYLHWTPGAPPLSSFELPDKKTCPQSSSSTTKSIEQKRSPSCKDVSF